ncbi:glycoside hydrolase family 3 protein [Mucilaginibacter calamicampi]|uniref:beta-N-acetylhexosaminidase n=1 Tax=Mucilaginibacter calamicampi TaxID=1302352 RepID=A0ABW2YZM5_9SPHI
MRSFKKNSAFCLFITVLFFANTAFAQQGSYIQLLGQPNQWVDSVYNKLNKKQRIAQLFFVRAHTNKGKKYEDSVAKVIHSQHVGGLVFFQGGPGRQASLIKRYQRESRVPLLIAQDGEWGIGMRLDSTLLYPYQMTLGAIQGESLIYKMGQQIAYDFKRLGMHMNFAPVMDVNNNPDNPVINYRSFGDNKYNVASKGLAYLKGMQSAGLLTTTKHFPGHGDTNVDSHYDLPLLPFSRQRLDSLELYPFKQAIEGGVSGVMIAHMAIPALDDTKNLPSTLSRKIVTNLLKDSLGFKGLVVCDAMEMQGVIKYFPDGEAELRAFMAGNDIIELSMDSKEAIHKILKAMRHHKLAAEEFEAKVKKVLMAKYWAGLNKPQEANVKNVVADLNRPATKELIEQLSNAAVTQLRGSPRDLQLNPLLQTAIIGVGITNPSAYEAELRRWYPNSTLFLVNKTTPVEELNSIIKALPQYTQVFVGVHDTRTRPQSKLDYSAGVTQFVSTVAARENTVISFFTNPYALAGITGIEKARALLVCYQNSEEMQQAAVKAITQQIKPMGKLPVSINGFFRTGAGQVGL